ncbi:MAG TPA: hypothetical protein VKW06_21015 [Candidatus Angelobacter sp.]|nr:hypothetical protein [Candidatus Angelobacter sp.]
MWPWLLFGLGAYHGLNPAMGWLFAVSLGLQEKDGKAVVKSIWPLGIGHLASVGLVVAVAQMAQLALPLRTVRVVAAVALIAFGLYRLVRRRHPRWVGMRVGSRDLTLWSFIMASAHGAGLMLLPFVVATPQPAHEHLHHALMAGAMQSGSTLPAQWVLPIGLHTLGYLLATAGLALVVYHKVGIGILRRAWFNLELLWVGALVATGVLTLFI